MTLAPSQSRSERAFTLVELVLSSALLTVLLLAGAATASLVRRAGMSPVGDSSLALANAMTEFRRDIEFATSVGPVSDHAIAMTVPDRTGNGSAESIAYSWSGTPGAPLTRTVNGGPATVLVASMHSFSLDTDTTTIMVQSKDQPLAPAAQTVGSCVTSSGLSTIQCNSTRWVAVAFPPSLPVGTTSWTLNSVRLSLRRNGTADSTFAVQVRTTNGQTPTSTVLGSVTVNESSLGTSYAYHDYTFTGISGLSPIAPLAIVLQPISGGNFAQWQFTGSGDAVNAAYAMFQSTNSGASWSQLAAQEPLFIVSGTPSASVAATEPMEVVRVVRITAESIRGVRAAFEIEARGFASASGTMMVEDIAAD
jgi:hypothetical protein